MTRTIRASLGALALGLAATGALAQEASGQVAANTDWSVNLWDNPKQCAAVSAPIETVNTKGGKPTQVKRGEIRLYVTYWGGNTPEEVSFAGGYPFAPGSEVGLDIGGTTFSLFVDGESAWAKPGDDAKIIAAMKAGASAILTAQSAKGTHTKDTFSLNGFSASADEAQKRCAG